MSLSQQERKERDVSMFGMSSADIRNMVEKSLYRRTTQISEELRADVMFVMSILSDAQEAMAHGDVETARQYINRAKYVLNYFILNEE